MDGFEVLEGGPEEDLRTRSIELGRREASLGSLAERLGIAGGVDPLTGLDNASRFEQRLAQELKRAARSGHPTAVAVIELTGWSALDSDALEAAALLASAAAAVRDDFRDIDTVALLRGARFAALLPMCDAPSSIAAVARVCRGLARLSGLRISAGIATTADTAGWDLLEAAQAALSPIVATSPGAAQAPALASAAG